MSLLRRYRSGGQRLVNGVEGMVGLTALVTHAVGDATHPGQVRVRGEEWPATALDPSVTIGPDHNVVIAAVEDGVLVVYDIGS